VLSFETLVFPVMALMGLAFLYSMILRSFSDTILSSVAFGLLFGCGIILAMSAPIHMSEDLIFDLRGLLVGLSVIFVGWIAGLITLVIGVAYRVYLGGSGMMMGAVALLIAFGIAAGWRVMGSHLSRTTLVSDAAFGLVVSLSLLSVFSLPWDAAINIITNIGPLIVLANVLGAVGLGFVLRREAKYVRDTEQLRLYASIDPLTNLLNRRGAADQLRRLADHDKQGRALFYFDVDRFKDINDVHGHAAGDAVLAAIALRIERCVRDTVIFSRHGGDEFTLFMPDVTENCLTSIGERFRRAVCDNPVHFQGKDLSVSISIGMYWTDGPMDFEAMLAHADMHLRHAKVLGRNRISQSILPGTVTDTRSDWPASAGSMH
jgi:diguanylate cyclase